MRSILCLASLLAACAARSQDTTPAPAVDAAGAAAPVASAGPVASAATGLDAGAAADACAESMLQPGLCVTVPGSVPYEGMKAWFAARDVGEDIWQYSSCDELRFGSEPEPVLLCAHDAPFWVDPATGINTRIELKRDLVLVTVKNKKPLELARLPLAVGDDNLEDVIFTAQYRVDAKAGAIDIEVSQADCDAAKARLDKYQADKMQGLRENPALTGATLTSILNAERHAGVQDLARIRSICKAAGHYTQQRGGKLGRAPSEK